MVIPEHGRATAFCFIPTEGRKGRSGGIPPVGRFAPSVGMTEGGWFAPEAGVALWEFRTDPSLPFPPDSPSSAVDTW